MEGFSKSLFDYVQQVEDEVFYHQVSNQVFDLKLQHTVGEGAHSIVYRGLLSLKQDKTDQRLICQKNNNSKKNLVVAVKSVSPTMESRSLQNPISILREIECLRTLNSQDTLQSYDDGRNQIIRFIGPMFHKPCTVLLLTEFMPLDLSDIIQEFSNDSAKPSLAINVNALDSSKNSSVNNSGSNLNLSTENGIENARLYSMSSIASFLSNDSEYENGSSKHDISNQSIGIPFYIAKFVFNMIVKGVNYIHNCNIVHRDLKPGNILVEILDYSHINQLAERCSFVNETDAILSVITRDELTFLRKGPHAIISGTPVVFRVKIADFGQSRFTIKGKSDTLQDYDFNFKSKIKNPNHPYTPAVCTRWYRAPELLYGSINYDKGVDLWSLGCIYAEMLSGNPILPGNSDIEQLILVQKMLGAPNVNDWPQLTSLPDYGKIDFVNIEKKPLSCLMASYIDQKCNEELQDTPHSDIITDERTESKQDRENAIELISKLLIYNSNHRLNIKHILEIL